MHLTNGLRYENENFCMVEHWNVSCIIWVNNMFNNYRTVVYKYIRRKKYKVNLERVEK